jgi:hypothetical protein
MKKEATAEKFRRKFLLFKNTKMQSEIKTERSSIKSNRISTQSNKDLIKRNQINLSGSNILKENEKKQKFERDNRKSSMSLTARRFYDRKDHKRTITENGWNIFDRECSIKKLNIGNKTLSKSFTTF